MGVKGLTGSPAAITLSITKIVGKSYTCNNKGTLTVAPNWGASAHHKWHHVDVLAAGKKKASLQCNKTNYNVKN